MLLSLTYVSKPAVPMDADGLSEIWLQSLERNEASGITGGLFFSGEHFIQTIEGEEDAVVALVEHIRKDPRHDNVEIVAENDITVRFYPDSPMKLIDGSCAPWLRERFSLEKITDGTIAEINRLIFDLAHH